MDQQVARTTTISPRILRTESEEKQANGDMLETDTKVTHNTLRSEEEMQTEKQHDQQSCGNQLFISQFLGYKLMEVRVERRSRG
jgi:hypothetical protein